MNLADNEVLAVIEKVEFHYFVNDEYSKSSEGKFGIYVDYRFSKRGNYSGQNENLIDEQAIKLMQEAGCIWDQYYVDQSTLEQYLVGVPVVLEAKKKSKAKHFKELTFKRVYKVGRN